MRYLFKKMRKDLSKMWTQFFSVFMMAFLGVLIYTSMEGIWNGLDFQLNEIYEKSNLANAWVYGTNLTEDDFNNILELPHVKDINKSMTTLVKSEANNNDTDIKLMVTNENEISSIIVNEGIDFNKDANGIWLDESYANELDIVVGDNINIEVKGIRKEIEVVGLILHPEYVYYTGSITRYSPEHNKHGYGVINEKTSEDIFGKTIYNEIRISTDNNIKSDKLEENLEKTLGEKYYGYEDRDSLIGVSKPNESAEQIKKMSILFSVVFILLAMLTMQTTMSRLVSNQRIQIGTLTAIGFSKWEIIIHYSLYAVVVSLFGGILGILIGPKYISPLLSGGIKSSYVLPSFDARITVVPFIVAFLISLGCTVTTIISVRKDLSMLPSETLRGAIPKSKGKIFLEKINFFWKNLSFDFKWSLRDISRNKIRAIMGIIGVLGGLVLIMAGLGMHYTITNTNKYIYEDQYKYGSKIIIAPYATDEDKSNLIEKIDCDIQKIMESSIDIVNGDKYKSGYLTVIDKGDLIKLKGVDEKVVDLPTSGGCISRKVAEDLNIKVGDIVKAKILGESNYFDIEIKEILKAPSPQGIFISKEAYESLGKDFNNNSILLKDNKINNEINDISYVQEYTTIDEQYDGANEIIESIIVIFVLMIVGAILLAIVILYNLGILSYTERTREYATLKVLGFYQKEITKFALRENIITTIIGWLIGIPVGFVFLKIYVSMVSTDGFDWVAKISVFRLIIATLVTIGCSIGVSIILSLKVKKINMVEALKSVE